MPKPHTFPTLYDEVKTVSISFLSKNGYLKPNQWQSGTITWSRNGEKTGSISIRVNTQLQSPYLELDYKNNDNPINYQVPLVSIPSNIGKGVIWYFICPHTGKRCRKLYLIGGYFYHRSAFKGCMYELQTWSKNTRREAIYWNREFNYDKVYSQIYKKYFKKTYKGKLTKRYIRLMRKIK